MKKFWGAVLLTAAIAAIIPYSYKRNKKTGELSIKALLWKCTYSGNGDENLEISSEILERECSGCGCADKADNAASYEE